MKLTVANPVTIGKTAYSTLDMVKYLVDTDRRYNLSAEAARAGVRTVHAFESGSTVELSDDDLRLLSEVIERPARGWGSFKATREVSEPQPDGSVRTRQMPAPVNVPAREFLPLIDPIALAAAKLPKPTA